MWQSIPELVRWSAEKYGEAEAVVDGRVRVSYRELGRRVERAAAACAATGLRAGDRVGIWAPNSLEWIVAALGAVSAGGVLVPLNTRFKGAEAADVLRRSGARLLFVTGTFLGTSYVASLRRAAGEGAGTGPLPGLPELRDVVVLAEDAPEGFRAWGEFLAGGEGAAGGLTGMTGPGGGAGSTTGTTGPGDAPGGTTGTTGSGGGAGGTTGITGSSPSDIIFTSGTTGSPKGAVITHEQTLRGYDAWSELAGLREGDRYLVVNPFFHTFGYKAGVIACLTRGATIIPQPVFDVTTALANIAAERVTVLPGPPTLHQSLLDHPARASYDLSSLRLVVTGAAVVPLRLVERLRDELGVATVLTAYGLSEASGIVTMCRRGDSPEVIATTSGRAIPGTEVRVADAAGAALPPGEPGEVLVRGFNVMRGYYGDDRATREVITPDGWLRTGDVGVLDEAGNLRITDRIKDMFIVGGFNAYPAEIEQILGLHPAVADVAVVGIPDARLGEVGKAYVVRRAGSVTTGDDLIAWARREMANYKVPRLVEFVGELPRNASGKVVKGLLRT
ncbi:fatty acid--CoA ligase family protein [Streptomyces roseirectus]|uniref:Fatty acid--CoA ligase family protein n=1 Tax=Streptomyces roseirectus TaxID=2768066 RepID=A0A7H0IH11_9ACTN|nr:fatty acid--CoA ligase family protein [Streptomyces roseirectus]QNP72077.1 fatty acid--CoA ligase family protein [Streptomyces roseirectus]